MGRVGAALEFGEFGGGEGAVGAGAEAAEGEGGEGHAFEAADAEVRLFAHQADLAVAAFGEGEAEAVGTQGVDLDRANTVAFKDHGRAQAAEVLGGGRGGDGHFVDLAVGEAGVREALDERAIVGDQEEAFTLFVEAANADQAQAEGAEAVERGGGALAIGGADFADGFIVEEGVVGLGLGADGAAIEGEGGGGVDARTGFGDNGASHGDAAGADELGRAAPRGHAALGKEVL